MVSGIGDGGIGQSISVLDREESHWLISINLDVSLKLHFHWSIWIRISLPGNPVIILCMRYKRIIQIPRLLLAMFL